MFRLEGLSAAIREAVPSVLADLFAAITTLGDPLFLAGVVAVLYWLAEDRQSATRLVGYTLVGVAVTISLKEGLALPRPPADVQAVATDPGSKGFPSGHAIGATVVYGGAVLVFDRLRSRGATAVAAAVVALISLSRVVIGVHYLGDVLVGVLVGLLVLTALQLLADYRLVFPVAALAAVPGVVVTGGGTEATFVLGACAGAGTVAFLTDLVALPTPETVTRGSLLVAVGLAVLGVSYLLTTVIARPAVTLLGGAILVGGSLVLPALLRAVPLSNTTP